MGDKSTALAVKDIHGLLDQPNVKAELRKALPKHLTADRLVRLAATMIQKSPQLKECTPLSLLACVVECAQLGLEPDSVLGEIYIVPFKGTASIIVGYKGFAKLIYNMGDVYKITSHIVRKGEKFHVSYGTHEEIEHVPKDHGPENDDSTWLGAYAVAHHRDGHTNGHYLERAEIFRRRSRSHAFRNQKKDSPWFTDPESMWKKTAIRALAAWMPKSAQDKSLARAAVLDDLAEAGVLTPTPTGFEIAENASPAEIGDLANGADLQPARMIEDSPDIKKSQGVKKSSQKSGGKGAKGDVIDVQAEKPKSQAKNDRGIGSKESTEIYNKAFASGWTVDGVRAHVLEKFGCRVADLRVSMVPDVLKSLESGQGKR
jgi:recombination protein RecT